MDAKGVMEGDLTQTIRVMGCDPRGFGSISVRASAGGDRKWDSEIALSSCAAKPTIAAEVNDGPLVPTASATPKASTGGNSLSRHPNP